MIFRKKNYLYKLKKYINLNLDNTENDEENIKVLFSLEENIQSNKHEKDSNKKIFNIGGFGKFKGVFYDEIVVDDEENNDDEFISYNKRIQMFPKIDEFITLEQKDENFQSLLFKYIDERNLNDSDVYNKVHIDRRLFSKIRNDKNYHPSKETIILLAISLELSENELEKLLESASYSLPRNNHFDLIIRFCFVNKIYKVKHINKLLDEYNCKLFNY